ncbi:MAG: 16S rRNA (guanine(527)-N(7))-methyltransferase RsmG [Elusimicrobia bacterium]|nr:16S rRNA (guanine(527)-N(7))-methyltransferase RsmG [Elusimicrobiota bacterium]
MNAAQLLERAAGGWGLSLSPAQHELILRYREDLIAYNKNVNLTADASPDTLLLRHAADGLAAVPILKELLTEPGSKLLDLGSGGGFIGIAVKIAWPELSVTLMEPLKRKYDFLNLAAARLGLKGLQIVRASAGHGAGGKFHAVIARALAPLPQALELALPLTLLGGYFLCYQSRPPSPLPRLLAIRTYRLPLEDRDRCIAVFQKER